MSDPTPNCDRWNEVSDDADTISEFLEWCGNNGIELAEEHDLWATSGGGAPRLLPCNENRETLIKRFFGIDVKALDRERRALLGEATRG